MLSSDQWAMDYLQNSTAVQENGCHRRRNNQPGAHHDTEGACEGLLQGALITMVVAEPNKLLTLSFEGVKG